MSTDFRFPGAGVSSTASFWGNLMSFCDRRVNGAEAQMDRASAIRARLRLAHQVAQKWGGGLATCCLCHYYTNKPAALE